MDIITVAIITKNEAKNISKALESAAFADERLVIDSGSTDNTVWLAKQAGARVIELDWIGHIGQKNRAIDLARFPWVFQLDADERITPELAEELRVIVNANPQQIAYRVCRENWVDGSPVRFGRMARDFPIRFFRKGDGHWTGLNPHDYLAASVPVKALKNKILHFSYQDLDSHLKTLDTYSRIAAESLRESGVNPNFFDIHFRPPWAFFRDFVICLGFLDGKRGFRLACLSQRYTSLKWRRLRTLNDGK